MEAAGKAIRSIPEKMKLIPTRIPSTESRPKAFIDRMIKPRIKVMIPLAKPQRQPSTSW